MSDSQKFIARNRAPRVQIEYDVELYGSEKSVQLPFVMGVLSDLSGKPEKQLPTLLKVLHFLHSKGAQATLPAILKDEVEALLGDADVPPTFRLVSVNIARIAMPESAALVNAITTDLDGSENPACVAAAAAGLASLPGKQLLEFVAKNTEGGTWSCKVS